MAFTNNFSLTGADAPQGSSDANNIDGYILDSTKKALNERYGLEHQELDGGIKDDGDALAEGRHKAGIVGCVQVGTLLERNALTGMGHGAIAYVTDEQNFYHYDLKGSTGWNILAINSDTIFADDESLQYVGNTLSMKRDNQQWVENYELTDVASIDTDFDKSNSFFVQIGGNRTLAADPTDIRMKHGATYIWVIKQDVSGNRTLSYGTAFKWAGGIAPTLSTDGNAVDIITALCLNLGTEALPNFALYASALYDFS